MTTERVIEIPWCLAQLPQSGRILDVGSCEAVYLGVIQQVDRELHCLDPRDCRAGIPPGAVFHHQSLIGNTLRRGFYDAVLVRSASRPASRHARKGAGGSRIEGWARKTGSASTS
jgi:hypothetical protein